MSRPLEGIRIIDLGTVIAGPFNTMQLADLGADVIKVEEPLAAERRNMPGGGILFQSSDLIPVGVYRDRNKEAISLNLKHPRGLEILLDLIRTSDAVTENFSPGTMDRMGIGYDVLKAINPKIVYASVSAFGQTGSYKHHRGYDILAQARTGFASVTGFPEDPPTRAGNSITDYYAGLLSAFSILSAIRHADRTGYGQMIDIALFEGLFMTLEGYAERALNNNETPTRLGMDSLTHGPTCAVYSDSEGKLVAIDVHRDEWWSSFCEAANRPDLSEGSITSTYNGRQDNPDTIKDAISAFMSKLGSEEAENILGSVGVPISRVLTVQEMVGLPHIKDRGLYPTVDHPKAGPVKITGTAYAGLTRTPGTVFSHPPMANEHGPLVLQRVLGYSREQVKEMEDDGVFSV